jgi:hypothetical protein
MPGPFARILLLPLTAAACLAAYAGLSRVPVQPPTEVAPGVRVSVERLEPSRNGSGRMYLASIELDPAKLELYLTPPTASGDYPLRCAHAAATRDLAVAVNGTMFAATGFVLPRTGSPARSIDTVVLDGKAVAYWEHSFGLGFAADLTPDPVVHKEIPPDRMRSWKWGLGVHTWPIFDSRRGWWDDGDPDRRTMIALDLPRRRLLLAVFDSATYARAATELVGRGATHVTNVDGGYSSTFAVHGKALTGDWRPVANHFGVRTRQ